MSSAFIFSGAMNAINDATTSFNELDTLKQSDTPVIIFKNLKNLKIFLLILVVNCVNKRWRSGVKWSQNRHL
jgi:hypothetical protein